MANIQNNRNQSMVIYPSLKNKGILITGGAPGIGATFVEAFLAQGAKVGFLDRDATSGWALVNRLSSQYDEYTLSFIEVDLVDIQESKEAVAQLSRTLGVTFQVLINNAGWDERHELDQVTPEFWDLCQNNNLRHQFFMAQALRCQMIKAGGGSVINLSSTSYLLSLGGMPAYLAAKAGIVGLTRGLARELGVDQIRVNAILPGWVYELS